MDETGFWIDYKKLQLVVTIDLNKPLCMINLNNYDYII